MPDRRSGENRPSLVQTPNWVVLLPRLLKQWQENDDWRKGEAFAQLNKMATDADGWLRTAEMLRDQHDRIIDLEGGLGVDHLKAVICRQDMMIQSLRAQVYVLKAVPDA